MLQSIRQPMLRLTVSLIAAVSGRTTRTAPPVRESGSASRATAFSISCRERGTGPIQSASFTDGGIIAGSCQMRVFPRGGINLRLRRAGGQTQNAKRITGQIVEGQGTHLALVYKS